MLSGFFFYTFFKDFCFALENQADIQALFTAHYEQLHRYAFTIVKDADEAKDIVQAVFLRILEKEVPLHSIEHPKAYLYRSVYNMSINNIRKTELQDKHHAVLLRETSTDTGGTDAEDAALLKQRVDQVLDQLPAQCREVFVKSRAEQKKYTEIASELGIAVKTVEAHMSKALKLIRQIIRVFVGIICLCSDLNW